MTVLIPMAGRGERYSKKGYTAPKPLIKIGSLPMVIKAVDDMPVGDKYIFIVLEEHINKFQVDMHIKEYITGATVVPLNQVTEGQACTALLGLPFAELQDELLIGACDNGIIYDKDFFDELKKQSDVLVFTFRNNPAVIEKPNQYGWVKVEEGKNVTSVSVKKAISDTPMKDHAVIGAFWFRQADMFKKAAERMIAENRRVNNEFYIDECINDAISLGYKVNVLEVDKYICWGTPEDFETYNYWNLFFKDRL